MPVIWAQASSEENSGAIAVTNAIPNSGKNTSLNYSGIFMFQNWEYTLAHEIGHILGLAHIGTPSIVIDCEQRERVRKIFRDKIGYDIPESFPQYTVDGKTVCYYVYSRKYINNIMLPWGIDNPKLEYRQLLRIYESLKDKSLDRSFIQIR